MANVRPLIRIVMIYASCASIAQADEQSSLRGSSISNRSLQAAQSPSGCPFSLCEGNVCCLFPFSYEGKRYSSCTDVETDEPRSGRWGFCESGPKCSEADEIEIYKAGPGYQNGTFPKISADCGQRAYSIFSGQFDREKFGQCMRKEVEISSSCTSCYAKRATFSATNCMNCVQHCLKSWCSESCVKCMRACNEPEHSEFERCVGRERLSNGPEVGLC